VSAAVARARGRGAVACLVVLLGLGTAVVAGGAAASRAAATPRLALLLGDSLTTESEPVFAPPPGWGLKFDAWPGMAPCDWLAGVHPNFFDDMKRHPAAVVIETAGNDETRCMKVNGALPAVGSPAFLGRYESALATIISVAHADGAAVILLAPPPMIEPRVDTAIKAVLAWAQQTQHVEVAWTPRLAVALFGTFTEVLPCMHFETAKLGCSKGWIPVRTLNTKYHVHFCPAAYEFTARFTCSVYSSGETRWARATMRLLRHLP
jgi:hypothetical protein